MLNLISFLIWIGFIALCIHLYKKHKGFHPEIFELMEGEEIVKQAKGDYWTCEMLGLQQKQNSGEFAFTNKRVLFKGTFFSSEDKNISISYDEIASVENAMVGLFFPMAFVIKTKNGEKYKFAILKRHIYIDLIKSLANQDSRS